MMLKTIEDSIAIVHLASPFLAILSIIVFEVPRYLISTIAITFFGIRNQTKEDSDITITVIIPTFNGKESIRQAVSSLKIQSANIIEIIVINDGSTDATLSILRNLFTEKKIDYFLQHGTRTGKSAAINHAARFAKGDLLLIIDADTVMDDPSSVSRLAFAFNDPRTAAASGNITVRNSNDSLWTSFQSLEYLASITAGRSFLDVIDSVACCSGAFSMFRRDVFLWVGGMNVGPGEDLEITLRLRYLGYKVRFVAGAIAQTRVPVSFSALARQRLRWDRDALHNRLFVNAGYRKSLWAERLGDVLQKLDFMIFEYFPSLFFPFYCIYLGYYFGTDAFAFIMGIYLYLLGLYIFNLALVIISTRSQLTWFDGMALFGLPFYQGFLMRFVRFYAFVTEIFLSRSQRDDFVPPRVRTALYGQKDHAGE